MIVRRTHQRNRNLGTAKHEKCVLQARNRQVQAEIARLATTLQPGNKWRPAWRAADGCYHCYGNCRDGSRIADILKRVLRFWDVIVPTPLDIRE